MAITRDFNQTPDLNAKDGGAPVPVQTSNVYVLVVEDHEDTRFMLRTMLEMHGVSVLEAENGEKAIALAENMHLDLILMDGALPLLDGFEATRRIREFTPTREVPIVFLSGHAQPEVKYKAFAAGCTDYLVKPFTLGELGNVLERHLSQGKAS